MRISIRTVAIALLGATVALGCSARRSDRADAGFARYAGVYRFEERVSPDLYLDGRFKVDADTIEVELKTSSCRPEPVTSHIQVMTVSCGSDVRIDFDRMRPVDRATYRAQVLVTETRSVCARFITNQYGQQICAEYRRESFQRVASRSGRLRPQRMDNVEWGAQ